MSAIAPSAFFAAAAESGSLSTSAGSENKDPFAAFAKRVLKRSVRGGVVSAPTLWKEHWRQDAAFATCDELVQEYTQKSGVLDDPVVWQQDHPLLLAKYPRVFALEVKTSPPVGPPSQPGAPASTANSTTGTRKYVVTNLDNLWLRYVDTHVRDRHFYELLREGHPCHLYFDIEFKKTLNPHADGDRMVDIFLKCLQGQLAQACGIDLQRSDVIELDSSTPDKFSRHLICHMRHTVDCAPGLSPSSSSCSSSSSIATATSAPQPQRLLAVFQDNIHAGNFVRLLCAQVKAECSPASSQTDISHSTSTTASTSTRWPNVSKADLMSLFVHDDVPRTGVGVLPADSRDQADSTMDSISTVAAPGSEHLPHAGANNRVIFVDTGMYTRNRCFRLYLSSKLGKSTFFTRAATNAFVPPRGRQAFSKPGITRTCQPPESYKTTSVSDAHIGDSKRRRLGSDVISSRGSPVAPAMSSEAKASVDPLSLSSFKQLQEEKAFLMHTLASAVPLCPYTRSPLHVHPPPISDGAHATSGYCEVRMLQCVDVLNPSSGSQQGSFASTFLTPAVQYQPAASFVTHAHEPDDHACSGHSTADVVGSRVQSTASAVVDSVRCHQGVSRMGLLPASPFPLVDQFVLMHFACKGGVRGEIRSWMYREELRVQAQSTSSSSSSAVAVAPSQLPSALPPTTGGAVVADSSAERHVTILYQLGKNRWCDHIGRAHKSNGVYIVADISIPLKRVPLSQPVSGGVAVPDSRFKELIGSGVLYQKCHDPVCKEMRYRSADVSIPHFVLDREVMYGEDPFSVAHTAEDGVAGMCSQDTVLEDIGVKGAVHEQAEDNEDALLLQAVMMAEQQQLAAATVSTSSSSS